MVIAGSLSGALLGGDRERLTRVRLEIRTSSRGCLRVLTRWNESENESERWILNSYELFVEVGCDCENDYFMQSVTSYPMFLTRPTAYE